MFSGMQLRDKTRADPDRRGQPAGAALRHQHLLRNERRSIIMPAIIALVIIAIVALLILSLAVNILFSPWLLVAIGILALIKFRPRRSHQ
jgi:uncharacterized membrane protein